MIRMASGFIAGILAFLAAGCTSSSDSSTEFDVTLSLAPVKTLDGDPGRLGVDYSATMVIESMGPLYALYAWAPDSFEVFDGETEVSKMYSDCRPVRGSGEIWSGSQSNPKTPVEFIALSWDWIWGVGALRLEFDPESYGSWSFNPDGVYFEGVVRMSCR